MSRHYVLGEVGARKLRALLNGRGASGAVHRAAADLALADDFVAPFTVQWAQSLNGGDGAWIIWLPGGDLVYFGDAHRTPATGLDAAGGDYPTGWYVLDDDVLDYDEGGALYLVVWTGGAAAVPFDCMFASHETAPANATEYHNIKICAASVDEDNGARVVSQFVRSTVILSVGSGGDGTWYGCDEASITRQGSNSLDPVEQFDSYYFHLKGFGQFRPSPNENPIGTYAQASESEIEVGGDATTFAVLCRDGNSSSPNANSLSYRKIKIKGGGGGCWKLDNGTLKNCYYNVGGITKKAADISVSLLVGGIVCAVFGPNDSVTATVYATLSALNTAQESMDSYIVPLYEIAAGGDVLVDLRNAPQLQVFEGTL